MDFNNVIFAFGLTVFAGLSTGIGSLLALFTKRTNYKFLSLALGFSAGVMVYISMIEILPESRAYLTRELGSELGPWVSVASFFAGILIIAIIDKLVPTEDNPHEPHIAEEIKMVEYINQHDKHSNHKLKRIGVLTALAIAIHNFPEGLATFVASIEDSSLGIPIAIAIAIHNIPEGIAISIPVFYATGNRKESFKLSLLSGLSEPLGAIIGYFLLYAFFGSMKLFIGILFGIVAGIMVFISLDELLPTARAYAETHLAMYGLVAGMAVMAVSLLLFM
ncbi:zinc transporter ZupT [Alkalibaculum bacchi]|uniref:zinc transporter ZupT n=1 Tax=Alkalibaculum bacchi TaxID=645887 RepID=UPI0026EA0822|nr:zinc transporter ZupT [Alkalibaculum bacchi]